MKIPESLKVLTFNVLWGIIWMYFGEALKEAKLRG